jgi:hypothetical protein
MNNKYDMRKIRIHGKSNNAKTIVTIDNIVCNTVFDDCIFSFDCPSNFHGSIPVSIRVISGSIALNYTTATYPTNFGTITFPISINSFARIYTDRVEHLSNIVINEGETFNYDHLIINGPNYWITEDRGDLYVDDITTTKITPIFEYAPYTAIHSNNTALNDLIKFLLP